MKNKRSKKFLIYIMMVYIMLFQSSSIVLAAASTGTIPSQEGEIAQESNSNSEKENDTLPEANLSPETEEVECGTGYIEDKFTIPSIQEEIEPNMGVNSFSMQQQDTEQNTANQEDKTLQENETTESEEKRFDGTSSGVLPVSYSNRNNLPIVREQGVYGVCWSFAAIGAAEASIISKGLGDTNLDLSEFQLAYFFYHMQPDSFGNTLGDSNQAMGSDFLNVGGNSVFTTFALASWVGGVDEAKAPYSSGNPSTVLDNSLAFQDSYHLQNAYWINLSTDVEEVKKMIMQYGAVASAHYTDQATTTESTSCYNPLTYGYYYKGAYRTNHAIVIVGWDDTYSKSNFNVGNQPTNDGAWLVRNSWGTTLGDQGYFWISYEDSAFNNDSYSKAFVFDMEQANNYQYNYQYDGASGATGYAIDSGGSIANVFTAKGESATTREEIKAVSFALYDVNVDYSIQIYTELSDKNNPVSGKPMLAVPQTGSTKYVGYYTIPLENSVIVEEGKDFSVVITLSKQDGSSTYFFGDKSYQNGSWIKFISATNTAQSFCQKSNAGNWQDLSSSGTVARIKAFTTDMKITFVEATSITLNETSRKLYTGEAFGLIPSVLPDNATDKSVYYISSDQEVAFVNSSGVVTAIKPGNAIITAQTGNQKTATCEVTVTLDTTGKTVSKEDTIPKQSEETVVEIPIEVSPEDPILYNNEPASSEEDGSMAKEDKTTTIISESQNSNLDHQGESSKEQVKVQGADLEPQGYSKQEESQMNVEEMDEDKTDIKKQTKTTNLTRWSDYISQEGNLLLVIGLAVLLPIRKPNVRNR